MTLVEEIDSAVAAGRDPGGIEVVGVAKRFGRVTALDGVNLRVRPGEVMTVLGHNGAGKSTLLRILATTVIPDAGNASVDEKDVVADPAAARSRIGLMMAEQRSFYWRLSGRENLRFFASLRGIRGAAGTTAVEEVLGLVGMIEAADRRMDGYSSGMRARIGVARCLLGDTKVLLLDEPTASLDPVAARMLRQLFVSVTAQRKLAVLFATHDLHEAATVATQTAILAAGRVATTLPGGTPATVLEEALVACTPMA